MVSSTKEKIQKPKIKGEEATPDLRNDTMATLPSRFPHSRHHLRERVRAQNKPSSLVNFLADDKPPFLARLVTIEKLFHLIRTHNHPPRNFSIRSDRFDPI